MGFKGSGLKRFGEFGHGDGLRFADKKGALNAPQFWPYKRRGYRSIVLHEQMLARILAASKRQQPFFCYSEGCSPAF
jgi:hypothetical protein